MDDSGLRQGDLFCIDTVMWEPPQGELVGVLTAVSITDDCGSSGGRLPRSLPNRSNVGRYGTTVRTISLEDDQVQ